MGTRLKIRCFIRILENFVLTFYSYVSCLALRVFVRRVLVTCSISVSLVCGVVVVLCGAIQFAFMVPSELFSARSSLPLSV